MKRIYAFLDFLGGTTRLTLDAFREGMQRPMDIKPIMEQVYLIGSKSFPLVLIVAMSCGMVMALQFGVGLEKFGGKLYVPKIVSLSIVREMGPVFACLMLAARVGAGITSEIGSMKVTQQIDAIRALGTSPLRKIVFPRIIACLISIPLLSAVAIAVGVLGSALISNFELGLDFKFFMLKVQQTIKFDDYWSGMGKTVFFALFIAVSSCYYGLKVKEGTQQVGMATTKSVVASCIFVVIGDFILTKAFLIVEMWV